MREESKSNGFARIIFWVIEKQGKLYLDLKILLDLEVNIILNKIKDEIPVQSLN